MNAYGGLLALFVAVVLGVTAADAKHVGGRQTIETPPTRNITNELELFPGRRNSLDSVYYFEPSLRMPLDVYTQPLSARVSLTPLDLRSLGQVNDMCVASKENAMKVFASGVAYKPMDYIKYSDVPEMLLKYFLVKATWRDAQKTCADDGAALYTFDHSVQLDSAMANFYPLLLPWVGVQKARVDGGSMMCGYLHGPVSGKSSLQWDDCNAKREFICQKQGFMAKTNISHAIRVAMKLTSNSKHLSMATYLTAFVKQSQTAVNFLQPLISAAANQLAILTPEQRGHIETLMTQWQNFNFVLMPEINSLISTTPDLSSTQIHQIHEAAEQGETLYFKTKTMVDLFLPELNLNAAQQPTTKLATLAKKFYHIIARVYSTTDPVLTHEQEEDLQEIIIKSEVLISETIDAFSAYTTTSTTTPTPTTTKTTTAATPTTMNLAQLLQSILEQSDDIYHVLRQIELTSIGSLTPTDIARLRAIILQAEDIRTVVFPNIISMVTTNPTLTNAQARQLENALAQAILFYSSVQGHISTVGPKLNLNTAQQQAISYVMGLQLQMLGIIMQAAVDRTNGVITISAAQLVELENLLGTTNDAITDAHNTLTTTTTSTTPSTPSTSTTPSTSSTTTTPSTTTPVHGGHHHHLVLSEQEWEDIISQIRETVTESVELLHFLHSLSIVDIRTNVAQHSRYKEIINKVHSLHARQTEIQARLRSMYAQDKMAIGGKLQDAQGHLETLTTVRSALEQTLTMTSGKQQPVTVSSGASKI